MRFLLGEGPKKTLSRISIQYSMGMGTDIHTIEYSLR